MVVVVVVVVAVVVAFPEEEGRGPTGSGAETTPVDFPGEGRGTLNAPVPGLPETLTLSLDFLLSSLTSRIDRLVFWRVSPWAILYSSQ